jgi:uncharacterized membrane protein YkvA (DUF1232 family)
MERYPHQTAESKFGNIKLLTRVNPMNFISAFYTWYTNTLRNPKYRWWIIVGSVIYLFSPFDIAPDFLPIVGQVDDAVVLSLLVAELSQVMMTRLKARKGDEKAAETTNASQAEVDVEAIPIK